MQANDQKPAVLDCFDLGVNKRLDHVDLGLAVPEQASGDLRVELARVLAEI